MHLSLLCCLQFQLYLYTRVSRLPCLHTVFLSFIVFKINHSRFKFKIKYIIDGGRAGMVHMTFYDNDKCIMFHIYLSTIVLFNFIFMKNILCVQKKETSFLFHHSIGWTVKKSTIKIRFVFAILLRFSHVLRTGMCSFQPFSQWRYHSDKFIFSILLAHSFSKINFGVRWLRGLLPTTAFVTNSTRNI